MTDLARYMVALEVESRKYQQGLAAANKRLDRFERKQKKSVAAISNSFKKLAAVVSVGLFANHIRSTVQSADAMLKATQRIGGTVEALSELEHVADLSGVSFNTLTMGLQRMTRRVAEAAQGTGEAKGALRELGLNAERLSSLALDQQFEVIAGAISQVKSQSDRTRLAMKLFDSEGVALLQTMTRGAEGIREMRNEARDLGKTLTTDQAEAAAAANDAMTRLNSSVTSLSRNMILNLVPAIEAVATGWNALIFNASPFPFEKQIQDLEDELEGLRQRLSTNPLQFGKIMQQIDEVQKRLDEARKKQREAFGLDPPAISPVAPVEIGIEISEEDVKTFLQKYETAAQEIQRKLDELELFRGVLPEEEFARIREEILAIRTEGLEAFDLNEIQARQREFLADRAEQMRRELDSIKTTAEEIGLTFASAFEDAIVQAKGLRDIVHGLLQDILRILVRKAITEPLADFVGGFFDGKAMGGPVTAGTPYVVGEQGPEVFVPAASGRIVPNHELGGGVTVIQHNQIGLPPQWQAQLMTATQMAAAVAKESMSRDLGGRR